LSAGAAAEATGAAGCVEIELDPRQDEFVGARAVGGPEAAHLAEDGGPVPAAPLEELACGSRIA
jgi:hypothetical protein